VDDIRSGIAANRGSLNRFTDDRGIPARPEPPGQSLRAQTALFRQTRFQREKRTTSIVVEASPDANYCWLDSVWSDG